MHVHSLSREKTEKNSRIILFFPIHHLHFKISDVCVSFLLLYFEREKWGGGAHFSSYSLSIKVYTKPQSI